MMKRQVRLGHCHRCVYTWRMRRRYPTMCPRCKSRLWNVPQIRPVHLGKGLGIEEVLLPHRAEILRAARKYGASNIRVFGSVRRHEADARSDVDLLIDWRGGTSLLDVAGFRVDVQKLLGRKVDTVEEDRLHWALRPQVLGEAVPL